MSPSPVTLEYISDKMLKNGAEKVIFKPLANNDNSKQQIYLGSDFSVIKHIPFDEIKSTSITDKGATFKASLNLYWMSDDGRLEIAPNAQIILYPGYPEIRLSGILKGCNSARSDLMQPPSKEDRVARVNSNRFMLLGLRKDSVIIYVSAWGDTLSLEAKNLIDNKRSQPFLSVFYKFEKIKKEIDERSLLLNKLLDIYRTGPIISSRLDKHGNRIPYNAPNGAGYTLEAQFNIIPNGISEPDFLSWELKAHKGSVVTLMTPEPNNGLYLDNLSSFLDCHGTSKTKLRRDFASIHRTNQFNIKSKLTMYFEGYDPESSKIIDPDGGIMLRDQKMQLAAGWSFKKLIEHWKRKHENTCYVSYSPTYDKPVFYQYGPEITLATGINLDEFIKSIHAGTIYYDPAINMKFNEKKLKWTPKKRNQFRVKFKDISKLYNSIEKVNLDEWYKTTK